MAKWTIIEQGHDDQGFAQCKLLYNEGEIGTNTLRLLMDVIESSGQDYDTIEEHYSNGEVCRYTVADARAGERAWQQDLEAMKNAETNEAAGEGG